MTNWIRLALITSLLGSLIACASAPSDKTLPAETSAGAAPATDAEMLPTEVLILEQAAQGERKKGGGSSSIGTDSYDVRTQTAWFYGTRPVVTCFQQLATFGVSEKQSSAAVKGAIARWQDYFQRKNIANKARATDTPDLNFDWRGKCRGNEDFVIYLGTGPIFAGLLDLKAVQRLGSPAAYVNKTYMSRDLHWSKGYIRILPQGYYANVNGQPFPDWHKALALEAVLTHEIGHVLGFGHVPKTVMQAEWLDQVFGANPSAPLAIDGAKQLVTCETCSATYHLQNGFDASFFANLGLHRTDTLRLLKRDKGFALSDGKAVLPLQETSRAEASHEQTLLSNFPEGLNDSSQSFVLYGQVSPSGQNKIPMVLEFNSGATDGTLVLRSLVGGEIRETGRFRLE